MNVSEPSESERAWLEVDAERWRRAYAIVARRPDLDVSGVYHVICNLERSPTERLRRGLAHGRAFRAHSR